jgi:hypothetical protein
MRNYGPRNEQYLPAARHIVDGERAEVRAVEVRGFKSRDKLSVQYQPQERRSKASVVRLVPSRPHVDTHTLLGQLAHRPFVYPDVARDRGIQGRCVDNEKWLTIFTVNEGGFFRKDNRFDIFPMLVCPSHRKVPLSTIYACA